MKVTKVTSKRSYEIDNPNQIFVTIIYRGGIITVILATIAAGVFYSII